MSCLEQQPPAVATDRRQLRRKRRLWLGVIAGLILWCEPRVTRACSLCGPPGWASPPDGATVPASVTTLSVYTPMWANDPQGLTLVDEMLAPVRFHVVDGADDPAIHLLFLDEPMTAGRRYSLGYLRLVQCGPTTEAATSHFTAGPIMPLPAAAGTLVLTGASRGPIDVWTSAGSCSTTIGAAIADLRFMPAPEAAAYLPVAIATLKVDDAIWAQSQPGSVSQDGVAELPQYSWARRIDRLFAHCPGVKVDGVHNPPEDTGLTAGRHHLELSVHVQGAQQDPTPATLDVSLLCEDPLPPEAGCRSGHRDSPWSALPVALLALLLTVAGRSSRARI